MIDSIVGSLRKKYEHYAVLSAGFLDWTIWASDYSLRQWVLGQQVRIMTVIFFKDDQWMMVGFAASEERRVFQELIKVSGIGPKLALKILSALEYEQFLLAVERKDLSVLSSLPGVGKKTAQKILLALEGNLVFPPEVSAPGGSAVYQDLVCSLTQMGFSKETVWAVLHKLVEEESFKKLEEGQREAWLLEKALKELAV